MCSLSLSQRVSGFPTSCCLGLFYQVMARNYANGPYDLLLVANCCLSSVSMTSPFYIIFFFSLLYQELMLQHTCHMFCWLSILYPFISVLSWEPFEYNNIFCIYFNMPLLQNYNELEVQGCQFLMVHGNMAAVHSKRNCICVFVLKVQQSYREGNHELFVVSTPLSLCGLIMLQQCSVRAP